jgi:hypothetical protein
MLTPANNPMATSIDTSVRRAPAPAAARYTGQATDPDTGPVLALMAIALLAGRWGRD